MPTGPDPSPARMPLRPTLGAGPTRPRALYAAMTVLTTLGVAAVTPACGAASSYQGIGTLQPSGENVLIGRESVRLATCSHSPAKSTSPNDSSYASAGAPDPPPVTALSFGDGCVVGGLGEGPDFQPFPGQECTLPFPEGARRIGVDGLTVGAHALAGGIAIDLRGTDLATGRYVLYHFDGMSDQPGPVPEDPCPKFDSGRPIAITRP